MFLQSVRHGLRIMAAHPMFTSLIVLAMALGIGANTALFSVMDAALLQPLPYKNPDRLVWIWSTRTDRAKAFFSIPNFKDFREQNETLEAFVAFANWSARYTGMEETERLQGIRISVEAFEMLGVRPLLGRLFQRADGRPDSERVALLGYGLWKRRFGEDPAIIGKVLVLNDDAYKVIGVLPKSYTFFGAEPDAEMAVPLIFETDPFKTDRGANFLRAYARLKPEVTVKQAYADLDRVNRRLAEQFPDTNAKNTAPRVIPLQEELVENYRARVVVLFSAVGLLLLIGCTNVANLLLLRAAGRAHEVALRLTLGASRGQILQQFLTEGVLLTLPGGLLGLLIAPVCIHLLRALGPDSAMLAGEISLHPRVLLFTLCVSVLTGIGFGLASCFQAFRTGAELQIQGRGMTGSVWARAFSSALVVFEVGLSLILISGALLLIQSFQRLEQVHPGFRADHLLTARLSLPVARYESNSKVALLSDRIAQRMNSLPGAVSAACASILPLSALNSRTDFTVSGYPPLKASEMPAAQNRWVSPGYFRVMEIPILSGREFSGSDKPDSTPVVVIDQALAQRFLPGLNAIGMKLLIDRDSTHPLLAVEIVGVCGNVKHDELEEDPSPTLYFPLSQLPSGGLQFVSGRIMLAVRTNVEPAALQEDVRREMRSVDRDIAVSNQRTMEQVLERVTGDRRFNLFLISFFAAVALLLAVSGVYGVIAYSVAGSTLEIGIRTALGATRQDTLFQWIGYAVRLALYGSALGWTGIPFCFRLLSAELFQISKGDLLPYLGASVLLICMAVLAGLTPALRATRVDPAASLRAL